MNQRDGNRIDRDALLARVDLESLLDSLTARAPNRRAWHCIDPNHPDEHPSVTMTVDRSGVQRWRCWSGGHGGTAIDAIVVARQFSVGDAIRWLGDHHAHLRPVERTPAPARRPIGEPAPEVIKYVERAERLLWSSAGETTRDWLFARGLREPVLRANRVGADPGRRFLPRPKGFPAGWPAAVFPALTADGDINYLQARILEPRNGRGKYDNPAAHWATNPRLSWATPATRYRSRTLVVAEGIPDALVAAQAGFPSLGILGACAVDRQVVDAMELVVRQRGFDRVVLCIDADEPGSALETLLTDALSERGIDTEVARPPNGLDLTSWANAPSNWIGEINQRTRTSLPDDGIASPA